MEKIKSRERTCSSFSDNMSHGVPGVKDQPSLVVSMRSVEVREGHVNAAQTHLSEQGIKVKDHPHIYWYRCVLCHAGHGQ